MVVYLFENKIREGIKETYNDTRKKKKSILKWKDKGLR